MEGKKDSKNQIILESKKLLKQGKIDQSIKILKKSFKSNPKNFEIFHELCNILKDQRNISEYIELSKTIEEPAHRNYHLADAYFSIQDYKTALEYIEKALMTKENNPSNYNLKSKILLEMKKFDEALFEIDRAIEISRAIEINPLIAEYLLQKGIIFERQEKFIIALKYLKQARNIEDSPYIVSIIASVLNNLGKHDEAIKEIDNQLVKKPKNIKLLNAKSGVLRTLGRYDEAIKLMNKAVKEKPNSYFIKNNLARLYLEKKDHKNAIKILLKLNEMQPEHSTIIMLYQAYFMTNQKDKAISILKEENKKYPDDLDVLYDLLILYIETQEYEKAKNLAEKYLKKVDKNTMNSQSMIYNLLGIIYNHLGQYEKARSVFNKALVTDHDNAETLYNYACVSALNENLNESITMLRLALLKDPKLKEEAQKDEDFKSIRKLSEFKKMLENN